MQELHQAVQKVTEAQQQLDAHAEQQVAEHHPHHHLKHHHHQAPADAQPRT